MFCLKFAFMFFSIQSLVCIEFEDGSDAAVGLLEFIEYWSERSRSGVALDIEVESHAEHPELAADNWLRLSKVKQVRDFKSEQAYLEVAMSTFSENSVRESSYKYVESKDECWISSEPGRVVHFDKVTSDREKPRRRIVYKPFEPWILALTGELSLTYEARNQWRDVDKIFPVDRIVFAVTELDVTRAVVKDPKGELLYEFYFNSKFDGLPTRIVTFPTTKSAQDYANLSKGVRHLHKSDLSWKSNKDGKFDLVQTTTESLNGSSDKTIRERVKIAWKWFEVDERVFTPRIVIEETGLK